jgi:hypothetical protein
MRAGIKKYAPFLLMLFLIALAELIIYPVGEFGLNDDWAYARSVYVWNETGHFELGGWPAMTLFSHSLLGLFFVKLFGFSYTVLRYANMTLCLGTLFFLYRFFLNYQSPKISFLLCAIVVFNPYYMNLFNSFMTDLTFFNYSFLAFYFLHNYYKTKKYPDLFLFFLFSILALLTRQFGILLFCAYIVAAGKECMSSRKLFSLISPILMFLAGLLVLFFFEKYILSVQPGNNYQGLFAKGHDLDISNRVCWQIFEKTILFLKFAGSFFLVVFVLCLPQFKQRLAHANKWWLVIGILVFTLSLLIVKHNPVTGHLVINFGLGIESTVDRLYIGTNVAHGSNTVLFYFLNGLFVAGYLLFGVWFCASRPSSLSGLSPSKLFILVVISGYFLLVGIAETEFDRYCILPGIFLIVYLTMTELRFNKWSLLASVLALFLLGSFSVIGTRDYFTAARLKLDIKKDLLADHGVKKGELNPGAEHVFWNKTLDDFNWVNWDHYSDKKYLVTRGPLPDFSIYKTFTYRRYMPLGTDTFYVLKNNRLK